ALLDDFSKGTITYPLNKLSTGEHTLTVRAWDTHNNPSTKTITFWVKDSSSLLIERVYNSPNPVTNQTTFFVQHNRPRELLEANLYIFTIDGKRVWHNNQKVFSSGYLLDSLHWNAASYNGQKLNKGTYLYTIELISTLSQTTDTYSAKLIID
ncbi:MAG: peptidase C25, partial [Flavobacteriaceae bacterium]